MAAAAAELQRSIVESAAHPQAPALRIHTHQGDDDEIKPSGRRSGRKLHRGDGDAESAAPGPALERVEADAAVTPVDDDRHEDAHAAAARGGDQGAGVGFTVEGQVQRDALAGAEHGAAAATARAALRERESCSAAFKARRRSAHLFT